MMATTASTLSEQAGASMLEALVALAVLSLGLLGMAGMQLATSKYRVNVQAHAAVMQLVADLGERIRINPSTAGTPFGPGNPETTTQPYSLKRTWTEQQSDALVKDKDCLSQLCTAAERAAYDMVDWRQHVRRALPQGAAWVEGSLQKGFGVVLMWMDKEFTETSVDADSGASITEGGVARTCSDDAQGRWVQNCCPEAAAVMKGVRCWRYSLLP